MLSDQEKKLLTHFLSFLDDNKLRSLSNSITHGRLSSSCREEAIFNITLHSESLMSFFQRKKVTPSILLYFLNQMSIPVPGNATKEMLIRKIYETWNLQYQVSTNSTYLQSTQSNLVLASKENCSYQNSVSQLITSNELLKQFNALAFDDYIMTFANLFYSLLNSNTGGRYKHDLNKVHFFSDCKIKVYITGNEEVIEEEGDNLDNVLEILSNIKEKHEIFFNPNLSPNGVRGKTDCHGLICAVASGTLHQIDTMVGVFEQSFILRKDPFDNNTKIMESSLNLRSNNSCNVNNYLCINSPTTNNVLTQ